MSQDALLLGFGQGFAHGNGIECVPGEYCAIQFSAGNKMDGHTYGVEVALDWFLTDWWRVRSGYTYMDMDLDLHGNASATDTLSKGAEGASPHNKVFVRNWVELPWNLEFDSNLSYTDNLPSVNVGSYFNLDLILAWKPAEISRNSVTCAATSTRNSPSKWSDNSTVNDPPYIKLSSTGTLLLR